MKIILSRKGFDCENGGYASPVLPNGKLISLPIPSSDVIKYSDLKLDDNKSYFDLMKELKPKIKYNKEWCELTKETKCHLDPDIYVDILKRDRDWKASFGQINQSQSHLLNEGVREGDLFLFFGWFRQTILNNGKLCFDKSAPDLHILFGYLQIGKIIQVNNKTKIPKWMKFHPHAVDEDRIKTSTNTIYVTRKNLTWDEGLSGAGIFRFNKELVLTKEGLSRSKWGLPDFFKQVKISYHSEKSWKPEGYFKSVDKGQEFVIENNEDVENWAKSIIKNNS
ncbi:MAG: hypothetical protein ABH824_05210 [Nanoarchaeota archaeon]|nr:hypothetical protein [Nanoarchaeota archaeon]MBU1632817.1 hypothetical protein [Nanoarchaeota archaeon]MBU1876490.1 hypothetical protein [Nanoarchaeota archaeon]